MVILTVTVTTTGGTYQEIAEVDDSQWFKIDNKTGQIAVTSKMSQDDVTGAFDQDVVEPREEFMVKVTATDPSGATGDSPGDDRGRSH